MRLKSFQIFLNKKLVLSLILTAGLMVIAGYYFFRVVHDASQTEVHHDEVWTFGHAQKQSYLQMIVDGAVNQISPSPLYYLGFKFVYDLYQAGHSFGLSEAVFYRLYDILSMLISGFVIGFFVYFYGCRRKENGWFLSLIQILIILSAVWINYFHPMNYLYSYTLRAYNFWNVFMLYALVFFLVGGRLNALVIAFFFLSAMTSMATIYQVLTFSIGYGIVKLIERQKWQPVFWELIKKFILPVAVIGYYSFHLVSPGTHYTDSPEVSLHEFFHFWNISRWMPLLALLGVALTWRLKAFRSHLTVFFMFIGLYFMAPLINYISLSKYFFFADRHYCYFNLLPPLFLFSLALALPSYWEGVKNKSIFTKRNLISGAAVILLVVMTAQAVYLKYFFNAPNYFQKKMPASYAYLAKLSRQETGFDKGQHRKYLEYYRSIVCFMPQLQDARGVMGYCAFKAGNMRQATQAYDVAQVVRPKFFWFNYNLGVLYFRAEKYEKAAEYFKNILEPDFDYSLSFILNSKLIYLPLHPGGLPEIVSDLKQAHGRSFVLYVEALWKLKQYDEMLPAAAQGLKAGPEWADYFLYQMGRAMSAKQKPDRAVYFLLLSAKASAWNPEVFEVLAEVYETTRQSQQAQTYRKQAGQWKNKGPSRFSEIYGWEPGLY